MIRTIKIDTLSSLAEVTPMYGRMADDYIVCRIDGDVRSLGILGQPLRFDGLCICLVREGKLSGEIDFKPFVMEPSTILVVGGHRTLKIDRSEKDNVVFDILFLSGEFMQNLHFDLSSLNIKELLEDNNGVGRLTEPEFQIVLRFLGLLLRNAKENSNLIYTKNIGRAITMALLYQMMQLRINHSVREDANEEATHNRQISYVEEFMKLLQTHHTSERSISFYADKLFISPKYLSHLVKQATGRSASDWISQFVIIEAKNLLRFSNKNIQQVAYTLNFSSQSSFGKYFKHLTGMSPSEYQKN